MAPYSPAGACSSRGPIKAVICDLDGTLLDTEQLSTDSTNMILSPLGKELHWELKKKILGMPGLDWAAVVIAELEIEGKITPAEMVAQWEENFKALYPHTKKLPGADRVTKDMREKWNLPMAIATSSNSHAVELKRAAHPEMFDRFNIVICGNDPALKNGKPAPDIFLAAAQRLGLSCQPSEVLVIEDSSAGVEAAKRAGMKVIVVPDPRLPLELFHGADQVLHSLEDFVAEEWFR